MHIKIHVKDKILYLCDNLDNELNSLVHQPSTIFIDELSTHSIRAILKEMENDEIKTGVFFHSNLEELKKAVFKKFELIKAGGGLIMNENDEVLMIFRRGFWDLPKGKLDEGETLEDCAIREVKEETGLDAKLKKPLTVTYHTYEQGTHHILKESHWFKMKAGSHQPLVPQTTEDITVIEWVNKANLDSHKADAYPSIVDVLNLFTKE